MGDIYLVHKDHTNELYHYGVKGMKWGVRKAVTRVGDDIRGVRQYGIRRQIARNVSSRMDKMKTSDRMYDMSRRQRRSFNEASKYWKARAEGKAPMHKRGIVKRYYDVKRSYSLEARTAKAAVDAVRMESSKKVVNLDTGKIEKGKFSASNVLSSTLGTLVVDEITNKAFGHF